MNPIGNETKTKQNQNEMKPKRNKTKMKQNQSKTQAGQHAGWQRHLECEVKWPQA